MILRTFRPEDARELLTLFTSTIREVNRKDYDRIQIEAWAPEERSFDDWEKSFLNKLVIVVEHGDRLVGFGELEDNGHIDRFYVQKDNQGLGVGKAIIRELESAAKQKGIKHLFVEASITAQPFFLRMGFGNPTDQIVVLRGVEFKNYKMDKALDS